MKGMECLAKEEMQGFWMSQEYLNNNKGTKQPINIEKA